MSLADYFDRGESDPPVPSPDHLHAPVWIDGVGWLESDPLHAPYSDDQFAYFTDYLAYLNELPAEQYYRDTNLEAMHGIADWLAGYARFVMSPGNVAECNN